MLDAWHEEEQDPLMHKAALPSFSGDQSAASTALIKQGADDAAQASSGSYAGTLAWDELDRLKASASSTGCFTFAHRQLESHAVSPLVSYLRDECRAKFVDLSMIGNWEEASIAIASAVGNGMRSARSLLLDGNDIGGSEAVLDAWCSALHAHPGLQHVSLRNCNLFNNGAQRIAAVLHESSVLFSMDLSWNRFGDEGAQYLSEALNENHVLLELCIDGNQVCNVHVGEIGLHLTRNGAKLKGGVQATLHDLKRARNDALSSVGFARPVDYTGPHRPQVMGLIHDPFAPQDEVAAAVDKVWFNVTDPGICEELLRRAEADWRYNATDQELIRGLHQKIISLKVQRSREREHAEEKLSKIADQQQSYRKQLKPVEDRLYLLKEQLAAEIEQTKAVLKDNIALKTELGRGKKEHEDECRARDLIKTEARMLENSLTQQRREVTAETEALQRELDAVQRSVEGTEKDNEKCRKQLHAMRFETETERFGPPGSARHIPQPYREAHEAKVWSNHRWDWGPTSWGPRQIGEYPDHLCPKYMLTHAADHIGTASSAPPPLPGAVVEAA
eukprot:gnl/MRDRNA2_/MRDRNA2_88895_c0_seq1.p1 gnl/MRDRNA2_/MRDRNA2_88895_c0~~gnl/MRDRNA2_/MRDRNA2_88895_c0_seq1.p1  ORF type:complete len:561 (+),score=128.20 gnl/MRDRNA2_/MRDRNA2_88895_c0_seq1:118-1800(+)